MIVYYTYNKIGMELSEYVPFSKDKLHLFYLCVIFLITVTHLKCIRPYTVFTIHILYIIHMYIEYVEILDPLISTKNVFIYLCIYNKFNTELTYPGLVVHFPTMYSMKMFEKLLKHYF